jgi:hypothetical protein
MSEFHSCLARGVQPLVSPLLRPLRLRRSLGMYSAGEQAMV